MSQTNIYCPTGERDWLTLMLMGVRVAALTTCSACEHPIVNASGGMWRMVTDHNGSFVNVHLACYHQYADVWRLFEVVARTVN